jgi:hypothetical protein
MDFVGGFPTNRKGHDYSFVVVAGLVRCEFLCIVKISLKERE